MRKDRVERGKFIVLEGCEGSGKSLCLRFLRQRLVDHHDIVFTREPGGTLIGDMIRKILMDSRHKKMDSLTEFFLFCASRAQHVRELIIPALEAGKHVISDRFDGSTIAYQIWGRKNLKFAETFLQLNSIAKQGLEPGLVIYLDVEPEVGLGRKARLGRGRLTRFDREVLEFHQRVRDGYLKQFQNSTLRDFGFQCLMPTTWRLVPTTEKSAKEVKEEVLKIVKRYLHL